MHQSLSLVLLLLTAALFAVALVRLLRLPSLLAYLAIGIALGPHALGALPDSEATAELAEFGVVFLMFSIGLEFSLARLVAMRWQVFGLGGAQVLLTTLATMAIAHFGGLAWQGGLALGAAFAMSSTAIVARLLAEKLDLHSASGRRTMSVLLFQDLAVVPLLILIPALADTSNLLRHLSLALAQSLGILLLVVLIGRRLMRQWFDLVVKSRSSELFMLNVLWVTVGLAFLTYWAGLSLSLGAFLGGMLISETMYRHQVEADIRPFRDVLLGLFFITIGAMLDLTVVWQHIDWVALVVLGLVAGKGVLMLLLTRGFSADWAVSFRTAAQLAQAGEFGFVLLTLASTSGLLPAEIAQPSLAGMLLSMLLAPLLIEQARNFAERLPRQAANEEAESLRLVTAKAETVHDHAIICGFGRSGQAVARFLARERIPFIALDIDRQRVHQALGAGENVVFGDADREQVLLAAGLKRARILVVTFPEVGAALCVLAHARVHRPDLPVVVRAADDSQLEELKHAGASEVVPEVLEGSLMLAAQTLTRLDVPLRRVLKEIEAAREQRYDLLRERYIGPPPETAERKANEPATKN